MRRAHRCDVDDRVSSTVRAHNRTAWDAMVRANHEWTMPVSSEDIARARSGEWSIYLGELATPRHWFPSLNGAQVLCLAAGGGNFGPILAAAGAEVTVFDNSPLQLGRDRQVAEREGLSLALVEGDAQDLTCFAKERFDLIVLPVAPFIPEMVRVWVEAFRVTRKGGVLLAGLKNPAFYVFGRHPSHTKDLRARYSIPYSDLSSIMPSERIAMYGESAPIEFGHSLRDLIGGQLDAGYVLVALLEASRPSQPITKYINEYIYTKAVRPMTA